MKKATVLLSILVIAGAYDSACSSKNTGQGAGKIHEIEAIGYLSEGTGLTNGWE